MKRFTSILTAAALLFYLFSPALAEETDYEAIYAPILASVADLLSTDDPDSHVEGPGEMGIQEIRRGLSPEDALWNVGYAIQDLSGDGIPELILAQVETQEGMVSFGKRILAIYTCFGNSPSLLVEGWGRNRYYLLPDGSILNEGSSGAAYSCLGIFRLSTNGDLLEWLDFYFTDVQGEEIVTYYNQAGIWDASYEGNQLVDVDFWRLWEIMEADQEELTLTAFYYYQTENPGSIVVPQWYSEGVLEDVEQVTLSDSAYSTKIALCAYNGAVTDLQLLSLELAEEAQEDSIAFRETAVKAIPTLEPGKPLVIQLEFGCAIPNFGIRYTDNSGITKTYSVMQSGMDGSLLMNEIQ